MRNKLVHGRTTILITSQSSQNKANPKKFLWILLQFPVTIQLLLCLQHNLPVLEKQECKTYNFNFYDDDISTKVVEEGNRLRI